MPLPSNDELREMLGYASAYPWQHRAGAIHPNNDDATWVVAIVDDEDGQVCLDDDIDLMLLAPQLAEEVIRLREEIDMMADAYGPWHRWFAWYPVRTEQHGWRWLRTVERRQLTGPTFSPYDSPHLWFYRPTPNDRKDVSE